MGTFVLTDAKIYLGEYDVSGQSNQVAVSSGAEGLDDTTFGDDTRSTTPGLFTTEINGSGLMDFTDDTVDEKLFGKLSGTRAPIGILPDGEDEGEVGYVFDGNLYNYAPFGNSVGELAAFEFSAKNERVKLIRATALHADTRTATGNSTTRQLGAVSATQILYAALHVLAVSGSTPTLDVLVRSDDSGGMSSPTTRISFTQATTETSEWATPVAGAITDDYWDIDFTISGSTPSFRFVVFVGIQ